MRHLLSPLDFSVEELDNFNGSCKRYRGKSEKICTRM